MKGLLIALAILFTCVQAEEKDDSKNNTLEDVKLLISNVKNNKDITELQKTVIVEYFTTVLASEGRNYYSAEWFTRPRV